MPRRDPTKPPQPKVTKTVATRRGAKTAGSNGSPAATQALADQERALLLRIAGVTFQAIADSANGRGGRLYADRSGARLAVRSALRRRIVDTDTVEEFRAIESARNDDEYRRVFEVFVGFHPLIQGGKPVIVDGRPVEDLSVRLRAGELLLHISRRQAELHGLDAAKKFVIGGTDGPAVEIDVRERIRARAEELRSGVGAIVSLPVRSVEAEAG